MTLLHHAPAETSAPVRETIPPHEVPSPLRSLAILLVAILAITAAVFVAMVLLDSEPAEIHDSWMNVPGAVQTVEIHDSWMAG